MKPIELSHNLKNCLAVSTRVKHTNTVLLSNSHPQPPQKKCMQIFTTKEHITFVKASFVNSQELGKYPKTHQQYNEYIISSIFTMKYYPI